MDHISHGRNDHISHGRNDPKSLVKIESQPYFKESLIRLRQLPRLLFEPSILSRLRSTAFTHFELSAHC